jgi:hypothetical protein
MNRRSECASRRRTNASAAGRLPCMDAEGLPASRQRATPRRSRCCIELMHRQRRAFAARNTPVRQLVSSPLRRHTNVDDEWVNARGPCARPCPGRAHRTPCAAPPPTTGCRSLAKRERQAQAGRVRPDTRRFTEMRCCSSGATARHGASCSRVRQWHTRQTTSAVRSSSAFVCERHRSCRVQGVPTLSVLLGDEEVAEGCRSSWQLARRLRPHRLCFGTHFDIHRDAPSHCRASVSRELAICGYRNVRSLARALRS